MPTIIQLRQARIAVLLTYDYLEERAGLDVALRFLDSYADTVETIAGMPNMGALCDFQRPSLRRIRRWPVKHFENWMVYYRVIRDGVEIIHVIHGARDIESAFSERR